MKRESAGSYLSAVFVDYDNIYLSLKRRNEEAAKRFAKDAGLWLKEIETGRLITPTNSLSTTSERRIVMNRCYGNPVPRRNPTDNSTDMNSFPFVRHHFLRAGFEIIDCPPLTAQLKNSSDIRMVMDVRDLLTHDTYFDEFIILSGDADFTPVLHRLRAHARRTVIFANDHTAAPYTAISDGEVREVDLATLLLDGRLPSIGSAAPAVQIETASQPARLEAPKEDHRQTIVAEVAAIVRQSAGPVPLEVLADRAQRSIGHEKTVGTGWAGAGSFRELLLQSLPGDIRLTEQAPFLAYDAKRHGQVLSQQSAPALEQRAFEPRATELRPAEPRVTEPRVPEQRQTEQRGERSAEPRTVRTERLPAAPSPSSEFARMPAPQPAPAPTLPAAPAPQQRELQSPALNDLARAPSYEELPTAPLRQTVAPQAFEPAPATGLASAPQAAGRDIAKSEVPSIQQTIARIHEACQAPPLAPPEYRILFEVMAREINERGLAGGQTLTSIAQASQQRGINVSRDDVRFVLEVVSEADPWFEQGASPNLFAGRFRNFVVTRCRGQGMSLSADDLDLIDRWFAGSAASPAAGARPTQPEPVATPAPAAASAPQYRPVTQPTRPAASAPPPAADSRSDRWWSLDEGRDHSAALRASHSEQPSEELPRIVRTRLRG